MKENVSGCFFSEHSVYMKQYIRMQQNIMYIIVGYSIIIYPITVIYMHCYYKATKNGKSACVRAHRLTYTVAESRMIIQCAQKHLL